MAARQVGLERLRPDEARSAQAQRREQALLGEPVELDLSTLDPPGMNQGVARFGKSDF